MTETVIAQITNEEPFLVEIEEASGPTDTVLILSNPRRRDGREVTFLTEMVTKLVWSWEKK